MLKLLIRLWWLQQRRNFHKRDAFVASYLVFLYGMMGFGAYEGFVESGGQFGDEVPALVGMGLVIGMLIPDIFTKMLMKKDITAMDDYVKSRPVPEKIWNKFLLITNLVSFWNYLLPVITLPIFLFLLPVGTAFCCFLLFLVLSFVNGIYITCYRKATELMLKWPLVLGWIGMYFLMIGYMIVFSWLSPVMFVIGMFVLAAAVFAGLTIYLYNLKIYDEHKQKVNKFRGFSHINLFSLQYIGTLRAKRVRNMVMVITLVFLFDTYLYALLPQNGAMEWNNQHTSLLIYAVCAIVMPSLVLSQWTFGIEANFFQGLMTKPITIEQMMRNCFYYYVIVSTIAMLCDVPLLFMNVGVGITTLLGGLGLAVFLSLFNMPTSLFSSRLEIFQGSMFNMQGANMKINFYAFALLVPLGGSFAVYCYFGETVWFIVDVAMGLLAIAGHRWFISKIAAIFHKNRYKRMEKFMEA